MDETARNKRIDDFLLDRLSEQDRIAFLDKIKSDKDLKEEVEIRKAMIEQVETMGDLKLKEKILGIQKKVEGTKKNIVRRRFLVVLSTVAAAVLLLFLAYQWFDPKVDSQELYAQYYQAYELPFGSRSASEDKRIVEAGGLYQNGEYAKALPLLQNLETQGLGDDRITLAIAICQLEMNDNESAVATLRQASAKRGFLYKDQAKWYMALALLKFDQMEECSRILQSIADDHTAHFNQEAIELLETLQ